MEADSVCACVSSLAATALGAGALALPYAFSLTGVGLGLVTMTFAGVTSALSLQILMVAARYTDAKGYAAVLELAVGSHWASVALDIVLVINGFGALVCILIFEGDFIPAILAHPPAIFESEGANFPRNVAVMGAAVAAWPLTLSSNISALRYVSLLVPIVLMTTIVIVVWDTPGLHAMLRASGGRVEWWDFEPRRWLQALAIMVNAFASHMNGIPCVHELANPSVARIVKASVYGNLLVWILLSVMGIAGYLSWGAATQGDFLLNYPGESLDIWACRVMLALLVYLVLPVACFPTARSGAQLFFAAVGRRVAEVGPVAHASSATVLILAAMCVARSVRNVASVLEFLGGQLAASLMFWFPAVVYRLLLWSTQPRVFRGFVLLVLVVIASLCWASVLIKFV